MVGPASVTADTVALYSGFTPRASSSRTAFNRSIGATGVATLTVTTNEVTGLAAPTASSDAAYKSYVDSAIAGLKWKAQCACRRPRTSRRSAGC